MANKIKYSDGDIEDRILDYIRENGTDGVIEAYPEGAVFHNFTSARANLLQWYPFTKKDTVLEIGAGMGAITCVLAEKCAHVVALEGAKKRADIIAERCKNAGNVDIVVEDFFDWKTEEKFDYVIAIGVLEWIGRFSTESNPWKVFLEMIHSMLKSDGKLILAIENQYGMKYFCGAAEDHSGVPFDSLNDYALSHGLVEPESGRRGVRTFSKRKLDELLKQAGFRQNRFYYPLPDYKFPSLILSDDSKHADELIEDVKFSYSEEATLVADPKKLMIEAARNGVLPFFANSFLVEASLQEQPGCAVETVLAKRDYKDSFGLLTVFSEGRVTRMPMCNEAYAHFEALLQNIENLEKHGIVCIPHHRDEEYTASMENCTLPKADAVFRQLIREGETCEAEAMIAELRADLLQSSTTYYHGKNIFLCNAYLDMTFKNSFYDHGKLRFFDQEWCEPNLELNYVLYRSIAYCCPAQEQGAWFDHLGITENDRIRYEEKERVFLQSCMDDERCKWFDRYMYQKRLTIWEKNKQKLGNLQAHIEQLLQNERNQKAHIEQLLQNERNQKAHIEQLVQSERDLHQQIDCIQGSRAWKLVGALWKIRDVVLPLQSRRRVLVKYSLKFVRHPVRFVRKINKQRIQKALRALRAGEIQVLTEGVNKVMPEIEAICTPPEIMDVSHLAGSMNAQDYESFALPKFEHPLVSIVIPVYNQFHYTYACLKSILKNSGDVPYEVIIANDCSTDLTPRIEEIISGVRLITNEKNLRFLLNCNNAAKAARGRYILFLNNDTQVQANWLRPLVELIESDEKIGMVGSKLIYPDGHLQEAGGIVWQDGSAWNYGNGRNPESPEYNYVKEVDYVSGAAIMIRAQLWEQIGGFDERFAPAYCEDSDLAFMVRKNGNKVMYQPLSVVVHFEGVSNGTDTASGQKAYQAVNQKKFYEKWKDVLEREHNPNAVNSFLARDRSIKKRTVLMVDHYVPTYDKDAGSRTVFQYLKLFATQGYNVKFIGDNFYRSEPYTTTLQQMGIEVLYGPEYVQGWKKWIEQNGSSIQYVWLNRPHISEKYIDYLRKYTNAKIMYYGMDLVYLREWRRYEATGDKGALENAKEWKKKEYDLMRKMDISYTLSTAEIREIRKNDPSIQTKHININIFENNPKVDYHANERKDMIFVGGFSHDPNVDAVRYIIQEISPLLREKMPDLRIHIIGSNMPNEIAQSRDESLIIDGYVSDEELKKLYSTCRIAFIPLRYGAGVKGKVIEAMKNGLPVITTSVGAEGIDGAENILQCAEDAKGLVELVVSLYQNGEMLEELSHQGLNYVKDNFSVEAAKKLLDEDFS